MIATLLKQPDRTIVLHKHDFDGLLFDEYLVTITEIADTKDLIVKLIHKSEAPDVEFAVPPTKEDKIN